MDNWEEIVRLARPLLYAVQQGMIQDFNSYAMWLAYVTSQRSKCPSRSIGSVIARDKYIIATGYNGPTTGFPHPETCKRRDLNVPSGMRLELCPCAHSETNAISQAACNGHPTLGATLYIPSQIPCTVLCAPAIIGAGISRVVCLFAEEYTSDPEAIPSRSKFEYANVEIDEYHGPLRELFVELSAGLRLGSK